MQVDCFFENSLIVKFKKIIENQDTEYILFSLLLLFESLFVIFSLFFHQSIFIIIISIFFVSVLTEDDPKKGPKCLIIKNFQKIVVLITVLDFH